MPQLEHVEIMEMAVLGSVIDNPERAREVFERITPDEIGPKSHIIADVLFTMVSEGSPVTPQLLLERLRTTGRLRQEHPVLIADMLAQGYALVHHAQYVDALVGIYQARRLSIMGARIQQMSTSSDPESILEYVSHELVRMRDEFGGREQAPPVTLRDLLDEPFTSEPEWLIPDILTTADRLLITANEGGGKSVLLRQFALSYALGIHPFHPETATKPGKALIIDCENSRSQVVRGLVNMWEFAEQYNPQGRPEDLVVESRQSGVDLCDPADQAWFLRLVRSVQPQVICMGPLYRMAGGDINDESTVRCWQRIMEPLLEMGTSIVMEHHAGNGREDGGKGKRELRPIGSSVIRRWFSQGVGLRIQNCEAHGRLYCRTCRREATVELWRGSRDETSWPRKVRSPGYTWWIEEEVD